MRTLPDGIIAYWNIGYGWRETSLPAEISDADWAELLAGRSATLGTEYSYKLGRSPVAPAPAPAQRRCRQCRELGGNFTTLPSGGVCDDCV